MKAENAAKETQPKPAAFIPPEAARAPPAAQPVFFVVERVPKFCFVVVLLARNSVRRTRGRTRPRRENKMVGGWGPNGQKAGGKAKKEKGKNSEKKNPKIKS